MKKSFILWIAMLTTCMASAQVSTWDGTCEPWTHGTGTEADPFLIENAQQLAYLAYRVNNGLDAGGEHVSNHDYHYKLMVDIDLNGSENFQWTPIGYWNSDTDYQCFGGHFDGDGHAINELYINSSARCVGFWGLIDGAVIQNMQIKNGFVSNFYNNNGYVGGIVGQVSGNSVVNNCQNNSNVTTNCISEGMTGGIVGIVYGGTVNITNCNNSGDITSNDGRCGGIVGILHNCESQINNCFNIGDISVLEIGEGYWRYAGGIVGVKNYGHANITNCYNNGSVSLRSHSGYCWTSGILGANNAGSTTITNCYNVGGITSSGTNVGGISWQQVEGGGGGGSVNISNSYYLNTCGGNNTYGGVAMTSTQMRDPQFVTTLNQGQAIPVWESDYAIPINDGYPILAWQISGDVINENSTVDCTISPNPTNGKVIIEAEEFKHVSINNLLGQTIYDGRVSGNAFEYDFSKHKAGIYLIRIETEYGVAVKKVSVTW